ncbi:HAD family hydrolase [Candidatus Izemoplasma sp. B36]|uniref:HAD family hydrolase n=1 Tax=Candidatus Izemoplasma sp. B36 TaxID=3242468 RepID=UPI0035567C51
MEKYLIALDLDGTILYDFDSLSETLCEFMHKLQDLGHKIVIATGRPFRSSKFIYERFGLDTPIINYNGGLITHPNDKNFKCVNYTVDKEDIIDIFENNIDHIRNAFSEVFDSIYLYREEKEIEPLLHVEGSTDLIVGNLRDTLKSNTNGFIIIGKQGRGKIMKEYIDHKYKGKIKCRIWNISGEFDSILEIFTPESNKGQALEYVANYLGFDREQIIAIGDGHNDIEMIQYAKVGVCVRNAHPDLIKVADIVLDYTSSENAVYRFLSKYLTNNEK